MESPAYKISHVTFHVTRGTCYKLCVECCLIVEIFTKTHITNNILYKSFSIFFILLVHSYPTDFEGNCWFCKTCFEERVRKWLVLISWYKSVSTENRLLLQQEGFRGPPGHCRQDHAHQQPSVKREAISRKMTLLWSSDSPLIAIQGSPPSPIPYEMCFSGEIPVPLVSLPFPPGVTLSLSHWFLPLHRGDEVTIWYFWALHTRFYIF